MRFQVEVQLSVDHRHLRSLEQLLDVSLDPSKPLTWNYWKPSSSTTVMITLSRREEQDVLERAKEQSLQHCDSYVKGEQPDPRPDLGLYVVD
jgi:hypothetical protein